MTMSFNDQNLLSHLLSAGDDALDRLAFGVIGLDPQLVCERFNAFESAQSGLSPERVIGRPFFEQVAPCMNNYLVADRLREQGPVDEIMSYVLSVRVTPTPVQLRLLVAADEPRRFLVIDWNPPE